MNHGGTRKGAGRPSVGIDEKRMMLLISQGVSQREIARRFEVSSPVIWYRVKQINAILKRGSK